MFTTRALGVVGAVALLLVGCGGDAAPFGGLEASGGSVSARGGGPGEVGGSIGTGGAVALGTGGTAGAAVAVSTGGASALAGASGAAGGALGATGGVVASTGGAATAGAPGTGGRVSTGGVTGTGGSASGGHVGTGGAATGGTTPIGTGGMVASSGGSTGTGGAGVCRPGETVSCQSPDCVGTTTCTPAAAWGACFCPAPGTGGVMGTGGSIGTGGDGAGGAATGGAGGMLAGTGGQGGATPWCARSRPPGTPAMCPTVPFAGNDPRFPSAHDCLTPQGNLARESLPDLPNLVCYSGCVNKDTQAKFTATCFTPFPYSLGADGCPYIQMLCVLDCSECNGT